MRISSFNINKFCGAYGQPRGGYRNPKNIDFKSEIKEIVEDLLNDEDDIVFLQEFIDNAFINVLELFNPEQYTIHTNTDYKNCKSNVVAITSKDTVWEKEYSSEDIPLSNKILKMKAKNKKLEIICFHNTDNNIKDYIDEIFRTKKADIILGDFDGVIETYASDHNILSFEFGASEKDNKYIRNRKSNIPFSLHDSRIQKIEDLDDTIILSVDNLFQYKADQEIIFQGAIEFTKADIEECSIMIFNSPFGFEGVNTFSGEKLSFDEYKGKYPEAEFEIVTETYNGYDTVYQGWIWSGDLDPMFGIMTIWNTGDMIYKIKKEADM